VRARPRSILIVHSRVCLYCGRGATTRDHVPPSAFLERPYPLNQMTVPSCADCNRGFSKDEQYLLVLLGQIGTSRKLKAKLAPGGILYRTLKRAPRLAARLSQSTSGNSDGGVVLVRPEHDRVGRVVRKIALGLYALRYGRVPKSEDLGLTGAFPCDIRDMRPWSSPLATYTERYRTKRWTHVQKGVFSYLFVRAPEGGNRYWCILDFHKALWGVIDLPAPSALPRRKRRASPSRQLRLFTGTGS
jgi:hypothetical protein